MNGEMALYLSYFTEFGNGTYFALFHRIRVRCRRLMSSCVYNKAYYLNRLDSVKFGFQWKNRRKEKSGGVRSMGVRFVSYTVTPLDGQHFDSCILSARITTHYDILK